MDYIKTTLKTLITEDTKWIKVISAFPNSSTKLTTDELSYYKELSTYKDCKSKKTYQIIKKLLESQRSVHPAWFFILKEHFENDNFSFEEDIFDDNDVLDFIVPKKFVMQHTIQIIATLKIYYTILINLKIRECFITKESPFIAKYSEFKDVIKYLFFPTIELREESKFAIDLSYNFNSTDIHIEINEPHHKEEQDIIREEEIFCKTGKRIVHYYVSKDIKKKDLNECINEDLPQLLISIFYRMTESIYETNEYAGLAFYTFTGGLIDNLSIAILFNELKVLSNNKELTISLFKEKLASIQIKFSQQDIKLLKNKLKVFDNKEKLQKQLNKLFYNCYALDEINENTLLTESGFDYFLMTLQPENTIMCIDISMIYSAYKQEHDRIMSKLFRNAKHEQTMIKNYSQLQYNKLQNEFNHLTKIISKFGKVIKNSGFN